MINRMPLENYSRIRLSTHSYEREGVPVGTVGYIVEVYGNEAYEVEFLDENNNTIALFSVKQDEVEPAEPDNSSN
jgi:uncharacterized protein YkuJ